VKKAARCVLALALCAGSATPAHAGAAGQAPWTEAPRKIALKTGIPLIYHRDESSETTVIGIVVPGGRGAVPEGLDGLAHLTARLALEIPDEDKVRDLMSQATRMSLSCSEDHALLLVECLSENLEAALRVAAKIIQDPLLSGLRISATKEVMKLQARAEEDDAVPSARNAAFRAFYRGIGYGSSTFGTDASRKAIDRKDVLAFYRRHFTASGVFFSVATDLDLPAIQALLEKHFSRFPPGERADVPESIPALPADREVALIRETKQTYVGRAYALPAPTLEGHAKGSLLETLLGRGPGSRLWALRTVEKLAYNIDARLTWTRGSGILEAYLVTENAKADRAGEALDRALALLWENGLTSEELGMTKALAKAGFLRSVETKSGRVGLLGLFEVLGLGYDGLPAIHGAIDAVSPEAMNAYIREALAPERALRLTVGPAGAGPARGGPPCPD
jgi:predicted Zn-dependent peptidase